MSTYHFKSTTEAYDSCMTGFHLEDDASHPDGYREVEVETGDTIVIKSEKVVGLSMAWPVAVTEEPGHLHQADDEHSLFGFHEFTSEQIDVAIAVAEKLGYPLRKGGV
jgi:hypothetical protein